MIETFKLQLTNADAVINDLQTKIEKDKNIFELKVYLLLFYCRIFINIMILKYLFL